jgi:hypothetical protein
MLRVLLGVAFTSAGVRDGLRVASTESSGAGESIKIGLLLDAGDTVIVAPRVGVVAPVALELVDAEALDVGARLAVAVTVSGTLADEEMEDVVSGDAPKLRDTDGLVDTLPVAQEVYVLLDVTLAVAMPDILCDAGREDTLTSEDKEAERLGELVVDGT